MRKTLALGLTAVVSAATLGLAAPAHAADCSDYLNSSSELDFESFSIDLDTLQVRIQPEAVDDDVNMVVDEGMKFVNFARCVEGGLVTSTVLCVSGKAVEIARSLDATSLYFRYVYQDPATGEIVFDGGRLVADGTACV